MVSRGDHLTWFHAETTEEQRMNEALEVILNSGCSILRMNVAMYISVPLCLGCISWWEIDGIER